MRKARWISLGLVVCILALWAGASSAEYSWQKPHAKVIETGDLEWQPEPFVFEKGPSVRYIDFKGGNDAASGTSKDTAWKHHPWDTAATGRAAECTGVHTYIFKRGVMYRGKLVTQESGRPGNPIRLTSDPDWGSGEAVICGAKEVPEFRKGAHSLMPAPEDKVWHADLDFAPRHVWMVRNGEITPLKLARTPNWEVSEPDDVSSEWWTWGKSQRTKVGDKQMHLVSSKHLTGDAEYYKGASVWTEWGIVMNTPYSTPIEKFDPEKKAVAIEGPWYGASESIRHGGRFYLEDSPRFLDEAGEFWFDKEDEGGRLYVWLPGDTDPNTVRIEAARHRTLLDSEGVSHLHISGLTFRFGNVWWDLGARFFMGDVRTAGVRIWGAGEDIHIRNCTFEHLTTSVRMKAIGKDDVLKDIVIADNDIAYTDHQGMKIENGAAWGSKKPPIGRLASLRILRNRLRHIGLRALRPKGNHAVHVNFPEQAEIAGNSLHRCYGAGIFVFGGLKNGFSGEAPFVRIAIHHNRVEDVLLASNDWGGIETWQGGPFFVYDNVVGNPVGPMNWANKTFGHAYYMDGAFKNYHFNNIAWGKRNQPEDTNKSNTAAFQEIHSFQNTVFNNTIYKFEKGTRRQAPQAGRDKFLSNLWMDISEIVFRHSDKLGVDPNAAHAGEQAEHFAYETGAYWGNVLYDIGDRVGVFEAEGGDYTDLENFSEALEEKNAMAHEVGVMAEKEPVRNAAEHDWRPVADSAVMGRGTKVFVPWALYEATGEWNFTRNNQDPSRVIDEHWFMAPHYKDRTLYHSAPRFPLEGVGIGAGDYVDGPLENWTVGALKLNGRDQYLRLSDVKPPEVGLPETDPVEFTKSDPEDWVEVMAPEKVRPGQKFVVTVRPKINLPEGNMLSVHMHWMRSGGYGGWNAIGLPPREVTADQDTYEFTVNPVFKTGLDHFLLHTFTGPTAEWGDKTHISTTTIPAAPPIQHFNPEVKKANFLVECYFKAEPGAEGLLAGKIDDAGWRISLKADGRAAFEVKGLGHYARALSAEPLADGEWHHMVAEADGDERMLTIYVDGAHNGSSIGLSGDVEIENRAPLLVGGTPEGDNLAVTLDFLRISRGSLADARTDIAELYEWEFDGPQFRDFRGYRPDGKPEAGALERR